MTRINANLPPPVLSDEHLIAEQKEIWRLPLLWQLKLNNNTLHDAIIPPAFTLGEGHLFFFLDKGKFIHDRIKELNEELKYRRIFYKAKDAGKKAMSQWVRSDWFNRWEGEPLVYKQANLIVVQRILEKMSRKAKDRPDYGLCYYGVKETPRETIDRLLSYTLDK